MNHLSVSFYKTQREFTCSLLIASYAPWGKTNWFKSGTVKQEWEAGEKRKKKQRNVCFSAEELPYRESRLAAVSVYLPSCFSDYSWSRLLSTQLKPVVRLLFCMEALLSGLTAWLPREPGSRDRRIGEKKAFPGQLKHGERSRETKRRW